VESAPNAVAPGVAVLFVIATWYAPRRLPPWTESVHGKLLEAAAIVKIAPVWPWMTDVLGIVHVADAEPVPIFIVSADPMRVRLPVVKAAVKSFSPPERTTLLRTPPWIVWVPTALKTIVPVPGVFAVVDVSVHVPLTVHRLPPKVTDAVPATVASPRIATEPPTEVIVADPDKLRFPLTASEFVPIAREPLLIVRVAATLRRDCAVYDPLIVTL
jgi:hypothetical protein